MRLRWNGASGVARAQCRSLSEALEGTAAQRRRRALINDGMNGDDAAARAMVGELHDAVDFGEEGVVLAESDVESWTEAATALPHEDRPARDEVTVEALDTQPLRIGIAAVAGAALTFFMSHGEKP